MSLGFAIGCRDSKSGGQGSHSNAAAKAIKTLYTFYFLFLSSGTLFHYTFYHPPSVTRHGIKTNLFKQVCML